jgi:hypothetical protein
MRWTAQRTEENHAMKKITRKRLTLDRETVKTLVVELSTADLPHVRGAGLPGGIARPLSGGSGTDPKDIVDGVGMLC